MEFKEETLVQVKNTKRVDMYYCAGDISIELKDNEGKIANRLTIPKSNVWSVIRGLISSQQRFYRKLK